MCVQKHIKRQNDLLFNLVICQNKHVIKSFKKGKKRRYRTCNACNPRLVILKYKSGQNRKTHFTN